MKFGTVPLAQAAGHILAHTVLASDGRKLFGKGRRLSAADVEALRAGGHERVMVAMLEETDLHEDEAARRVGEAVAGAGVRTKAPGVGRANLTAEVMGPLYINVPLLEKVNNIDEGITIASLRAYTLVRPGDLLALVKIIPFGVAADRVIDVEAIARASGPVLWVRPLQPRAVGLVVSGPEAARDALLGSFVPPVRGRVEALHSALADTVYVAHDIAPLAQALRQQKAAGRDLVLVAGVSAIIDREDVVPQALRAAGGSVAHFGAPVDPGSLLMLGYLGDMPVVGAPGCIKSPKVNVIDWILPRLLAGERLTRADLVAMAHGGLLDDIPERPSPRSHSAGDE